MYASVYEGTLLCVFFLEEFYESDEFTKVTSKRFPFWLDFALWGI